MRPAILQPAVFNLSFAELHITIGNKRSKMDETIDTNAVGKRYMKSFYGANQEQLRSSITFPQAAL